MNVYCAGAPKAPPNRILAGLDIMDGLGDEEAALVKTVR